MATSSISLHQKKLEFEDNQFLSSLFGYHDKNLKVLEDKFKVKLYSRGNLLSIKGNRCLLYTSPSPRDPKTSRMPSSA